MGGGTDGDLGELIAERYEQYGDEAPGSCDAYRESLYYDTVQNFSEYDVVAYDEANNVTYPIASVSEGGDAYSCTGLKYYNMVASNEEQMTQMESDQETGQISLVNPYPLYRKPKN